MINFDGFGYTDERIKRDRMSEEASASALRAAAASARASASGDLVDTTMRLFCSKAKRSAKPDPPSLTVRAWPCVSCTFVNNPEDTICYVCKVENAEHKRLLRRREQEEQAR
jgi:hypothetical protein